MLTFLYDFRKTDVLLLIDELRRYSNCANIKTAATVPVRTIAVVYYYTSPVPKAIIYAMFHLLLQRYNNFPTFTRFLRIFSLSSGEGYDRGLTKGRAEGIADTARKMKAKGFAVEYISEITGLTAEEIEAL